MYLFRQFMNIQLTVSPLDCVCCISLDLDTSFNFCDWLDLIVFQGSAIFVLAYSKPAVHIKDHFIGQYSLLKIKKDIRNISHI